MNIFISHNHQDKEFVRRISADLRAGGFSVWLDEDIVSVGENWTDKITEALERSDIILVVLSANSSNSTFQNSEIAYALASQRKNPSKRVVPLVIDKKAELPFFLKDVAYADFSSQEKYNEQLQHLIQALSVSLSIDSTILVSDQRKIDAIKAEQEYLRAESINLKNQRAIWSSTVIGVVTSVIAATMTLIIGTAASAKWIGFLFQEWGGFISGLLVGVLVPLAALLVSKKMQRRPSNREVGDGE